MRFEKKKKKGLAPDDAISDLEKHAKPVSKYFLKQYCLRAFWANNKSIWKT